MIPDGRERLVVDLQDAPSIDSTGSAVLIRVLKRLRHTGADLVLRPPPPSPRKVLNDTGLDRVIPIGD